MERYQKFLHQAVGWLLLLIGLTSLFAAAVTLPFVNFLTDTRTWEGILLPLSLSLSVLALCRILCLFQKKELTKASLVMLLLLLVASALVPIIKKETPFLYQSYVFPITIGMTLPRVLLSLLPLKNESSRSQRIGFAVFFPIHMLLCLFCLISCLFFDPLSQVLSLRLTLLPLMLTSQIFSFLASRCHLSSYPSSLVMGILPLCHIFGISKSGYYRFFPLFFGVSLLTVILDGLCLKKSRR